MYTFLVVCAVVSRCVLVWLGSGDWLAKRVEVSTPVNSWSRSKLPQSRDMTYASVK